MTPRSVLLPLLPLLSLLLSAPAGGAGAQAPASEPRPEATEVWTPVPRVVDPGPGPRAPLPRPADAIALFDGSAGTSLAEWTNADGGPAGWRVVDGTLVVHKPAGDVRTRRRFTNYQLHLEYRVPPGMRETGQSRGNSGLFLAATGGPGGGYELQILDSYRNATYVNGQAASVYKQRPPLVNASRPPGEWQTYDVVWTAPTFAADGTLRTPAVVTAFHNGVLVQDRFALTGETLYRGTPRYAAHGPSPILLQAHGDPSPPLAFRNIWVRELP
jgi:hypothetical protein